MLLAEFARAGGAVMARSREHPVRHLRFWKERSVFEKTGARILSLYSTCSPGVTCVASSEGSCPEQRFLWLVERSGFITGLLGLTGVLWGEGALQGQPRWPLFASAWWFCCLLLFSLGQTSAGGDRLGSHYLFSSALNFLASARLSSWISITRQSSPASCTVQSLLQTLFWIIVPFLPKTHFHKRIYCRLFRH